MTFLSIKQRSKIPMPLEVRKSQLLALSKTVAVVVLALAMVIYPQEVLSSAYQGILMWGKYVLPALLPFFILSELLMGAGFVHLLGVVLEPIMRPVFRLPGCAGFVVAMGFTSGPPIGAILTAKLRKENLLSRVEAERLLTFTNNASPGFMLGAVAAGMFGNPGLGLALAFSNYLANLLLGIAMRFYKPTAPEATAPTSNVSLGRKAFRAMYYAQHKDARPLGQLIGDSVRNSINTILLVGGFILFFSVMLRLLSILGVTALIAKVLAVLLSPLKLDSSLFSAISSGLFEMTLGTKLASEASGPIMQKIPLVSALMAWSGISVHAQVASFTSGTDIRLTPFVFGRLVQTGLSAVLIIVLLNFTPSITVFSALGAGLTPWKTEILVLALAVFSTAAICLGVGILLSLLRRGFVSLSNFSRPPS
jgi:sporulation integral membrane protein YlbJ